MINYGNVIEEGLEAVIEKCHQKIRQLKSIETKEKVEKYDFYKGIILALEGAIAFAENYAREAEKLAENADAKRREELLEIARICRKVPRQRADTFREAVQSFWFIHCVVFIETNGRGVSPGRFDQYMYRPFKDDIESGRMTEGEALELLELLRVKHSEMVRAHAWFLEAVVVGGTYQNLTLGGVDRYGRGADNELSKLILQAGINLRSPQPTLSVRWNDKLSKDFKLKVERVDVEEESVFSSPSVVEEEAPLIPKVSKGEVYHRIHEIVESLPLYRYPVSMEDLPENGICFFYEEGEKIPIEGEVKDRIVRVETHRDEGGFRDMVFNHFEGDKNSSGFRRQLGGAIISKKNLDHPSLEEWLKDTGSIFDDVEALIDEELRERFSFRCVRVDSEEERVDFEERLIASLALYACFQCSKSWLGRVAPSDNIRIFGLWNEKHLESDNVMTLEHLLRLEELTG